MTTNTIPPNRTNTAAKDAQVIVGINKDLQTMSNLPLGGQTYTPSSLAAQIQSRIDAANAVAQAKANWQHLAATYEAINTQTTVIVRELKNLVIGAFGPDSPKLMDFGFAATKRTPLTVEEKAAAAAKAKATRLARGTKSKKAKAKITGATPVAAPATLAPAPTALVVNQPAPAPAPVAQAPAPTTPAVVAPVASPAPAPAPTPAPAPHS
jgi:Tfp pilus assembly major pilin PilA